MGRDTPLAARPPRSEGHRGRDWAILAALFITFSTAAAVPFGRAGDSDPAPAANPYITYTDPKDNATGVPLYSWIYVQFSDRMNASNTIIRTVPEIALTPHWLSMNTSVLYFHDVDLTPCTMYWVYVDGTNVAGQSLLLGAEAPGPPNPWIFTTACPVFTITRTIPSDGQTGVPVNGQGIVGPNLVVWFSRPVDPASLRVTLFPSVPLTPIWSNGNTKVTLDHSVWFQDCTVHFVTVSATDAQGNPLTNVTGSKPNPWSFTTTCLRPVILRTDPPNGTTDVGLMAPIVVTFGITMDPATVGVDIAPTPPFALSRRWTDYDHVLTLTHDVPWAKSTTYAITVTGQTPYGINLEPGPVPNPWSFTTTAVPAPTGLHVARASPDIRLTWNPSSEATSYVIYSSPDKFAPWPWVPVAEVPSTGYVHGGADVDGVSYYYVVRAKDSSGAEGGNSTMGIKAARQFVFDSARTNIHWISLPYRSRYVAAKDIADELTASRIAVVGKWDPATQRTALWYYFRGAWRGTNFAILPGDGLYISVRSSFEWVVNGTDGPVPHTFSRFPPPHTNFHWFSMPFTSTYARASDVVLDIEGSLGGDANRRIVEVAKWDGQLQVLPVFAWTPSGWGGTDFPIGPGEGLRLRVITSFPWTPRLITREVP